LSRDRQGAVKPSSTHNTTEEELERRALLLNRSLAANRFEEARRRVEECVALHDASTHEALLRILERARQLAMIQRSLAAAHIEDLRRAAAYLGNAE
jgi:hypothetical protein